MNVTFPDNATIQIFVVPSGVATAVDAESGTSRILLASPVRRGSRRRDVLFLGTGAILCIAVLSVVRFQGTGHAPVLQPAHASSLLLQPPPALPLQPVQPTAPDRADSTTPPPDVDPREAVRRLLAERPTMTPPPGAQATVPAAAPSGSDPATPGSSKRNAFGMTD